MRKHKKAYQSAVRDIVFLTDEEVTGLIDYLVKKRRISESLYVSLSYDSSGQKINEIHQVKKEGS
jgi:hypothetical protein